MPASSPLCASPAGTVRASICAEAPHDAERGTYLVRDPGGDLPDEGELRRDEQVLLRACQRPCHRN